MSGYYYSDVSTNRWTYVTRYEPEQSFHRVRIISEDVSHLFLGGVRQRRACLYHTVPEEDAPAYSVEILPRHRRYYHHCSF